MQSLKEAGLVSKKYSGMNGRMDARVWKFIDFWVSVQAYTCALEFTRNTDEDLRKALEGMLDYL
ncbi:hypothetical protein D3C76_1776520 [compost metagenome]